MQDKNPMHCPLSPAPGPSLSSKSPWCPLCFREKSRDPEKPFPGKEFPNSWAQLHDLCVCTGQRRSSWYFERYLQVWNFGAQECEGQGCRDQSTRFPVQTQGDSGSLSAVPVEGGRKWGGGKEKSAGVGGVGRGVEGGGTSWGGNLQEKKKKKRPHQPFLRALEFPNPLRGVQFPSWGWGFSGRDG